MGTKQETPQASESRSLASTSEWLRRWLIDRMRLARKTDPALVGLLLFFHRVDHTAHVEAAAWAHAVGRNPGAAVRAVGQLDRGNPMMAAAAASSGVGLFAFGYGHGNAQNCEICRQLRTRLPRSGGANCNCFLGGVQGPNRAFLPTNLPPSGFANA